MGESERATVSSLDKALDLVLALPERLDPDSPPPLPPVSAQSSRPSPPPAQAGGLASERRNVTFERGTGASAKWSPGLGNLHFHRGRSSLVGVR